MMLLTDEGRRESGRSHEGELHRKQTAKVKLEAVKSSVSADTRPHKRRSPDKNKLMATNCGGD